MSYPIAFFRAASYWDGKPLAYRSSDSTTYFQHQDYLGTERMRTNDSGAVAASFTSLPWGDGYAGSIPDAGAGQETFQFAGMDQDTSSAYPISEHAQFRQYSYIQGRWLSPDPYDGSYDFTNPQSLNRYAYALNNPLSYVDPLGLDDSDCGDDDGCGDGGDGGGAGGGGGYSDGGTPADTPPPGYSPSGVNTSDGNPIYVDSEGNQWIGSAGSPGTDDSDPTGTISFLNGVQAVWGGLAYPFRAPSKTPSFLDRWPFNGNMIPMKPGKQDNACTTGPLSGPMNANPAVLSCCQAHDNCYAANGCNATSWIPNDLPWGVCNVCNAKAAACITGAVLGH